MNSRVLRTAAARDEMRVHSVAWMRDRASQLRTYADELEQVADFVAACGLAEVELAAHSKTPRGAIAGC